MCSKLQAMNIPKIPPPIPRFSEHGHPDPKRHGPRLLVSVRSAAEAEIAAAGGADLIDVKEPRLGSLGKAEDAEIHAILHQVAGRTPVSAALGEVRDDLPVPDDLAASLSYLKWGLAGRKDHDWRAFLTRKQQRFGAEKVVCVAYADWTRAGSPAVAEVMDFACQSAGILLIDTFAKQGSINLLSWLSRDQLADIARTCRAAGIRLALAGSLGEKEIADLWELQPDWFAVRGAVCASGRESAVDERKVRRLAQLVHGGVMEIQGEAPAREHA
jgi:uncharacterized protein (UPF0264 family)